MTKRTSDRLTDAVRKAANSMDLASGHQMAGWPNAPRLMTTLDMVEALSFLRAKRDDLLFRKGKEYADDDVRFRNLHQMAAIEGRPAYKVGATFLSKHILALLKTIKEAENPPMLLLREEDGSEGFVQRIQDSMNWLEIVYCLIMEEHMLRALAQQLGYSLNDEGGIESV